ncbi:TonB-dependent receptor [Pseudomonas sp. RL]|uniref:TonB-dependent receptor plug domain-containing protein n=1 Tax=Pseudomonas sp. RL TaxID=1452718 RepID=UPI0009DDAC71|nr:TonB-dependent receptor [Pseudomonas sp. RL]
MPFPGLAKSLPPLLLGLTLCSVGRAHAFELFLGTTELPEILTATRLQQAPAAVPGSITVLDRELIRTSGAREITELLRLVPGMLVIPEGSATTVNYHGGLGAAARRLQVMVDGRSVYRPALAQVDWVDIPVAIEDIERIEVFRGPNTVSYGANALLGVINIITRQPSDSLGTQLSYTTGKRGIEDWYARHGFGWDGGAMRISLSAFDHDRFDMDRRGNDFPDSQRLSRLNLRSTHELDSRHSLDWQLALKSGTNQDKNYEYSNDYPANLQDPRADVDARDYAASLRWNIDLSPTHRVYVQGAVQHWERIQEWRACAPQIYFSPALSQLYGQSPSYVNALIAYASGQGAQPVPATPQQMTLTQQLMQDLSLLGFDAYTCGLLNANSRENRFDLEVQDTLSIGDHLRLISGTSYRHDAVTSETYFDGSRSKNIARVFGHLEWYATSEWLLQGGAMYEHDSMIGESLSPRVAVNYLFHPAHGIRAVYAEAVRSPDMFEESADWRMRVRNLQPAVLGQGSAYLFLSSHAQGGLRQEHIVSRELGYNGHFANLGLHLDVRLFDEDITDLITFWPSLGDPSPTNDDRLSFRGWESDANWQLGQSDRLRLSYAYIEFQATHHYDSELTPRHSGSLSWLREWGRGWNSNLTYLGADSLNENRFERLDLHVTKRFQMGSTGIELSGTWQQRLDDNPLGGRNTNYKQRHVYWLSAGVEL